MFSFGFDDIQTESEKNSAVVRFHFPNHFQPTRHPLSLVDIPLRLRTGQRREKNGCKEKDK